MSSKRQKTNYGLENKDNMCSEEKVVDLRRCPLYSKGQELHVVMEHSSPPENVLNT